MEFLILIEGKQIKLLEVGGSLEFLKILVGTSLFSAF